jgi:hypothetical protein
VSESKLLRVSKSAWRQESAPAARRPPRRIGMRFLCPAKWNPTKTTERPGPEAATLSQARRLRTIIWTRNSANLNGRLEGRGAQACRLGEPEQALVRVDSEDIEGEVPRHGGRCCAAV